MTVSRMSLFGLPLDVGADPDYVLQRISAGPLLLSYLNPFAYAVARRNSKYRTVLEAFDLVVCDGIAVQKAVRQFLALSTPIVSLDYSGIGRDYLKIWQQRGSRICLVGSRGPVVQAARDRLHRDFPGINIEAVFDGYEEGPKAARDYILETGPEVLLVGLGMGMQEQFLLELKREGWNGTGICVGAFFDRLANPKHDYPEWSRKYNVRFLGNLSRRPGYYLRRYGVDYLPFLKHYVLHLLHRR